MNDLLISAIKYLSDYGSTPEYPLYHFDKDDIDHLSTTDTWTNDDKRKGLYLFVKYRRILIRAGFDYYSLFPKNNYNHDLVERTNKIYKHLDYLVSKHKIKPPRAFDLMPLEDVEEWVRNKIIEMRVLNAGRDGITTSAK